MSKVFVVDRNRVPLDPVHPGYARRLLSSGKAAVLKRFPFTIVLKATIEHPQVQPLHLKLDPGSRTTGVAIVNDVSGEVVFATEITHRGQAIKEALDARRARRRSRRQRKTRYRKAKFQNRRRQAGWMAPSLASRVANIITWVHRFCKVCNLTNISMELVKFNLQQMENPEISGVQYQQGTLAGYEVRQYLLEKWNRQCSYCGKKDVPLQVEHIHPRANGGTNRISNLCLACEVCNQAKGTRDIKEFLANKPAVLNRILAQAKAPLKDAAAVNTTRWMLFERLKALGLPLECGSGGLTKFNRTTRGLPKAHWIDASCVGKSTPEHISIKEVVPLLIKAMGHGRRKMCVPNKYGFPKQHKERQGSYLGYRTGDIVKAVTPKGTFQGRIAIRYRPSFRLGKGDIHPKYMRRVHRVDGYEYTHERSA
jgi:hypothetical protein